MKVNRVWLGRLHFYRYQNGEPTQRLIEKQILVRQPISKGWLHINLDPYDIYLQEDFVIGLEFLPSTLKYGSAPSFMYGAKLGGMNGFSRNSSLGKWEKVRGAAHSLY